VGTNRRGSILVEGIFGVGLLTLALMLCLEIVRRSQYEIVLHHSAFLVARASLFSTPEAPRRRAVDFWKVVFGEEGARTRLRGAEISTEFPRGDAVGRVHLRFESFLKFPYRGGVKNGFEVTRKCRFALSR
jgi:hypothetical protein